MKIDEAFEQSSEKVAILIIKKGKSIQILTAIKDYANRWEYNGIVFKNGTFVKGGGFLKRELYLTNKEKKLWEPL